MSYEEMGRDTQKCHCGVGTITNVDEMDDWNRCRSYQIVECPVCSTEIKKERKSKEVVETARASAYEEARMLAQKRHLASWLRKFDGLSKKSVWLEITNGGKHYPALGTFYSHIKHYDSTEAYLKNYFSDHFEGILQRYAIADIEIDQLIVITQG